MEALMELVPEQWHGIVTIILAIYAAVVKWRKGKVEERSAIVEEVAKKLIAGINESRETMRAGEVAKRYHKLVEEKGVVEAITMEDLEGIDLGDLDVAKIVHRKVNGTGDGTKTKHGNTLDELIEDVETGAENREKGAVLVKIAGRIFKLVA
jgi:hypothetical protein